jgi:hypothetical protein
MFAESTVEQAALDWLSALGYSPANMIEYTRKRPPLARHMGVS